jgi:hypothetical protein
VKAFQLREPDPNLLWIQCDPAFDFLHTDQRYRSLIQRIGLPPAYLCAPSFSSISEGRGVRSRRGN